VITREDGAVVERLSWDAWGKRRHPDRSPDPNMGIQMDSLEPLLIHIRGKAKLCCHQGQRWLETFILMEITP
jgi:hypothetical protein